MDTKNIIFDPLPKEVRTYLDLPFNQRAEYLFNYHQNFRIADNALPFIIKWPATNQFATYKIEIFSESVFVKHPIHIEGIKQNFYKFRNPIPGVTYFYRVYDDKNVLLHANVFKIKEGPRIIDCGNIVNIRDIGGYHTPDGILSYGVIYRSKEISQNGGMNFIPNKLAIETLVLDLKIKTEIDLRIDSNIPPLEGIKKYYLGISQYDYLFPNMNEDRPCDETSLVNLRKIFELFTDIKNYPILYHCSAGADRTASLTFLLNGLLGVSYEDLVTDFELSSFYVERRWRSDITHKDDEYFLSDSGVMQDDEGNLVSFNKIYKHVMATYSDETKSLSKAIENYLINVIGLTNEEIKAIKKNLIVSKNKF